MKSWALPKGPSLDPRVKRLAIEVEDHDLAYADFEGVVQEGHYGAGPVLVWDIGWYEPVGQRRPAAMWQSGVIDIVLHGRRLRGRFALIRMNGRTRQWLLIKQPDEEAHAGRVRKKKWDSSVLTGRTIEDLSSAAKVGLLEVVRCGA